MASRIFSAQSLRKGSYVMSVRKIESTSYGFRILFVPFVPFIPFIPFHDINNILLFVCLRLECCQQFIRNSVKIDMTLRLTWYDFWLSRSKQKVKVE